MADFQPIPINGTAEQLEKLLTMDIVESVTENSTDDQIPTARAVKDAIASVTGGTVEGAVLYTAQNLTPEQQAQARKNIGAESVQNRVTAIDETADDEHYPTAKAVLDYVGQNEGSAGLTDTEKSLLLTLFRNAAYTSADMGDTLAQLESLWGGSEEPDVPDIPVDPEKTLTSISVSYSGGDVEVGTALSDLNGVVVIAHYSDGSNSVVTGYKLSGTIAEGSNTIAVSYGGKTTTFTVTGVAGSGGDGGEVVTLKNISFDGTSYLDTEVIPESVNYRYVLGIQAPNEDIVTNKNFGGISMRDQTDPAQSAYWDLYWYCTVVANNYNADVPRVALYESCMGLTNGNGIHAGQDKGDGASTQPFDYPVYYNLGNGSQSMWRNEECTESPVTGHFAAATTNTDFTNQSYYTDDEHPIDSIWLGKVHVTGIMSILATEANTYAGVKFYCFKVYDSDENLIADMRPAKQGNAVGMWCNVRNKFYPANGTANYEEVSA